MVARTTSRKELVFENNEWKYKKTVETEVPDYRGIWTVDKSKTQVTYEDLSTEGLSKSLELDCIIVRLGLNPKSGLNVTTYLVQKIRVSVPKEKSYRHVYLSTVTMKLDREQKGLLVFEHFLNRGVTTHLSIEAPDETVEIERVGKPVKATSESVRRMFIEGKCYAHILEDNESGQFTSRTLLV